MRRGNAQKDTILQLDSREMRAMSLQLNLCFSLERSYEN
jgi:hypothetical protein